MLDALRYILRPTTQGCAGQYHGQIAVEGYNLPCMYLAHHELESMIIIIIIIVNTWAMHFCCPL